MRQIKFRVRNTTTEQIVGYEELFPQDRKNSIYEWAASGNGQDWGQGILRTDPLFVYEREQFTGRRDKNNKEIYEFDLVRTKENIYRITYEKGSFLLYGKNKGGGTYFIYLSGLTDDLIEVVGNELQNLELLNKN